MTRYRVYKEGRLIKADVSRRKYWLFGPWVTDVYVRKSIWWENQRTGKLLSTISFLYGELETRAYIAEWEST